MSDPGIVSVQYPLLCDKCGLQLVYFHSAENQKWFVAHSHLWANRKEMKEKHVCADAEIVFHAPKLTLEVSR